MSVYLLIPLFPLLAFVILAMNGRRLGETSHWIGIPAIVLSFGLSIAAFVEVLSSGPLSIPLYRLLQAGDLVVDLNLYVDQLSVLLLLLVTGMSAVIHVYSSRYMIGDPRYSRFFATIALFTFAMVMMVMSNNLLMTYAFWEIMGICSYLLISHWPQRKAAAQAATKAFLVNAVADVGLGLGVILTFSVFGTLDIQRILAEAGSIAGQTTDLLGWAGFSLPVQTATLLTLLLFCGTLGKSAQVPLHVWLPFAMEAPTPVSALIHAATMVNAGPFLLVRLSPLIVLSPAGMIVIAIVGAATAIFGALVSITQSDIKKILAYSTISQIGFMIMTCGVGAFVAAIFHLLAHGFLKGFLFLSTGNALRTATDHAHEESELAEHSSLGPIPSLSIGALILACIVPFIFFSGPYQRMWTNYSFVGSTVVFWVVGLTMVFFTAMYLYRGIDHLFGGRLRIAGAGEPVAVQPQLLSITHVLGLAVAGAVGIGLLMALWSWFVRFLTPAVAQPAADPAEFGPTTMSSLRLILPILAGVAGWSLAYLQHRKRRRSAAGHSEWMSSAYVLFLNKLYFDEIYDTYVVRPTLHLAGWLWREVDIRGLDRLVDAIAALSVRFSRWLWRAVDVRGIDRTVDGTAGLSVQVADWLWHVVDVRATTEAIDRVGQLTDDTGHVFQDVEPRTLQHHLVVVVGWLALAIGVAYWLVL
jgi:NADH-quinone oxidoreductase subunit L